VPLAAAGAVIAIAAGLLVARLGPGTFMPRAQHSTASPTRCAYVAAGLPYRSALAPAYSIALCMAHGGYDWLVADDTADSKPLARIGVPAGQLVSGIYGSDDDLTFVISTYDTQNNPDGSEKPGGWYVLRISPKPPDTWVAGNVKNPLSLTALPAIPAQGSITEVAGSADGGGLITLPTSLAGNMVTGVAVSPDGGKVAIATERDSTDSVRVYSTTTAALIGTWTAAGTTVTVTRPGELASTFQHPNSTLRWLGDGRRLAFAVNGTTIQMIDTPSGDGSLLAHATVLLPAHPPATNSGGHASSSSPVDCDISYGWSVSADGMVITCAGASAVGTSAADGGTPATGTPVGSPACSGRSLGFLAYSVRSRTMTVEYETCGDPLSGFGMTWTTPDGTSVIGEVNSQYGIYGPAATDPHGSGFEALPLPTDLGSKFQQVPVSR
jgi:hypothetical protein